MRADVCKRKKRTSLKPQGPLMPTDLPSYTDSRMRLTNHQIGTSMMMMMTKRESTKTMTIVVFSKEEKS